MSIEEFNKVWDYICKEQIAERKDYSPQEQIEVYNDFLIPKCKICNCELIVDVYVCFICKLKIV